MWHLSQFFRRASIGKSLLFGLIDPGLRSYRFVDALLRNLTFAHLTVLRIGIIGLEKKVFDKIPIINFASIFRIISSVDFV